MLAPGEVYNFDKQIGPRTAARGYKLAPGIVGPGKLEDVFGGGICQVSTTLFNAVFFAGLEVVERHNHSIYIDHYPKGRDATVTGGGKNLRFKNDTGHWIWIRGTSDGITTTFNIYGTDEGRKVSYSVSDFYNVTGRSTVTVNNPNLPTGVTNVLTGGQSGKQLTTKRVVKLPDGTVLHNDKFISYFPMVPRQVEVGTGSTTTTTTVPSSTTTTTGGPPSSTTTTGPPTTEF
jgi:vancomycin resistance protein YoaR